jgi:hypothetical protein
VSAVSDILVSAGPIPDRGIIVVIAYKIIHFSQDRFVSPWRWFRSLVLWWSAWLVTREALF